MPYTIKKNANGTYSSIKKTTGKVVSKSDTLAKAKGTIWHCESGDKKK